MKKEMVPIMFRVSRNDSRDVFALFPTLPGTNEPPTCTCYQHVGQHSSAHVYGCIMSSRPAKAEEYADLLRELTRIYHDCKLRIVQRESRKMQLQRYQALGVRT